MTVMSSGAISSKATNICDSFFHSPFEKKKTKPTKKPQTQQNRVSIKIMFSLGKIPILLEKWT